MEELNGTSTNTVNHPLPEAHLVQQNWDYFDCTVDDACDTEFAKPSFCPAEEDVGVGGPGPPGRRRRRNVPEDQEPDRTDDDKSADSLDASAEAEAEFLRSYMALGLSTRIRIGHRFATWVNGPRRLRDTPTGVSLSDRSSGYISLLGEVKSFIPTCFYRGRNCTNPT